MLARLPLFQQGTTTLPVKITAEDTRLNLSGMWTPSGADALSVRSGIVSGPGASGFTPCQVIANSGPSASLTVKPGRIVMQGLVANQGAYVATVDGDVNRTLASATINPGLPGSGQYKTGFILAHLYDQAYGDTQDGWDIEIIMGAPASTPGAAPNPTLPVTGAWQILRQFSVDSAGTLTLLGYQLYTSLHGRPVQCLSILRPTTPWAGMEIFETDTQFHRRWDGQSWEILSWHGRVRSTPGLPGMALHWSGNIAHNVNTDFYGWSDGGTLDAAYARAGDNGQPLITYPNQPGQSFRFGAKGKVRVTSYAYSDYGNRGRASMVVLAPQLGLYTSIPTTSQRQTGYAGSGVVEQVLDMTLNVLPGDTVGLRLFQFNPDSQAVGYNNVIQQAYYF